MKNIINVIGNFLGSLLSRKFIMAAGSVLLLVSQKQYIEAVVIICSYLGINGLIEVKTSGKLSTVSSQILEAAQKASDEVDTSEIFTGAASIKQFNDIPPKK